MRFQHISLVTFAIALSHLSAAIAVPPTEITLGDTPIRNQEIAAGAVRVVLHRYDPMDFETGEQTYISYDVYVNNDLVTQARDPVDFTFGDISLQNLDPDEVPEVVFHRYSGGAHCCSTYTLYSWQEDYLYRTITYPLDAAAAGTFEDLDGDGYSEFTSADERFLYAFGSYASSWPPSLILSFREGSLVDVTEQFPKRLRSHAYAMYERTRESTAANPEPGVNSILAGYVAQKILLGEYPSGWDYMLAHYDPDDTWGLTATNPAGDVVQQYADYPAALSAMLIDLEYLKEDGRPNPNLDRSRVIVQQEVRL
jgi:hypothetical protein